MERLQNKIFFCTNALWPSSDYPQEGIPVYIYHKEVRLYIEHYQILVSRLFEVFIA